jgi:hypothetical protein
MYSPKYGSWNIKAQGPASEMTVRNEAMSHLFVVTIVRTTEKLDGGCASEFSVPWRDQAPYKETLKWTPLAGNAHTEMGVARS